MPCRRKPQNFSGDPISASSRRPFLPVPFLTPPSSSDLVTNTLRIQDGTYSSIDTTHVLHTTVPHHAGFLAGKFENMWILPLVGYMGLGLGFAFLTLAIGMLFLQLSDVRVLK
jgi:hypothetical protein